MLELDVTSSGHGDSVGVILADVQYAPRSKDIWGAARCRSCRIVRHPGLMPTIGLTPNSGQAKEMDVTVFRERSPNLDRGTRCALANPGVRMENGLEIRHTTAFKGNGVQG